MANSFIPAAFPALSAGDFTFYPSADSDKSEIGQGDSDTDITYIALRNSNGTLIYIYPDAAGTAVTVSASKP